MGNRFLKIFHFAVMAAAMIAVIVFMVLHLTSGTAGQTAKLWTLIYVLLIIWAGMRVWALGKEIFRK